jgi:hypothetical protein
VPLSSVPATGYARAKVHPAHLQIHPFDDLHSMKMESSGEMVTARL